MWTFPSKASRFSYRTQRSELKCIATLYTRLVQTLVTRSRVKCCGACKMPLGPEHRRFILWNKFVRSWISPMSWAACRESASNHSLDTTRTRRRGIVEFVSQRSGGALFKKNWSYWIRPIIHFFIKLDWFFEQADSTNLLDDMPYANKFSGNIWSRHS